MSVPFTADVCAAAIVASAATYGDHPIRALECRAGHKKRSVAPAVAAIAAETGAELTRVCSALGTSVASFKGAVRYDSASFRRARRAAESALAPFRRSPAASVRPAPVDHTPAIREALQRRRPNVTVAGVDADKKRLALGDGGCRGHMHLKALETICDKPAVRGRLFCEDCCRALGQKTTPVDLAPATLPRPYRARADA